MPFGNGLIASSVYIVVGLTIDRYVAVCHPSKYRNVHNHRVASVRIAVSFVAGFFIYIPMSFGKRVVSAGTGQEQFLSQENFAITNTKPWIVYKFLLEICARFAPAALLAFLNSWIIVEFKKISRRRRIMMKNSTEMELVSHSLGEFDQAATNERKKSWPNIDRATPLKTMTRQKEQQSESINTAKLSKLTNGPKFIPTSYSDDINMQFSSYDDSLTTHGDFKYKTSSGGLRKIQSEMLLSNSLQKYLPIQYYHFLNTSGIDSTEFIASRKGECPKQSSKILKKQNLSAIKNITKHCGDKWNFEDSQNIPPVRGCNKPLSGRRLDMERHLVLLLVAIIFAFFITNIPSAILSLTFTEDKRMSLSYQIFRAIANNLEFLNFGLNFILYFLFSKDIRRTFVALLRRLVTTLFKKFFTWEVDSKWPNTI